MVLSFYYLAIINPKNFHSVSCLFSKKKVLQYWEEIRHITVTKDTPTFKEVIIWNNSNIKVDGKTVYYRAWHYKGVTKLIDLLEDQKRFLSFGAFTQKYEVKTTFIDYYGLTHALGPLRPRILVLGPRKPNQVLNWYDSLKNITNASLHNIIVKSKFLPPNHTGWNVKPGCESFGSPKTLQMSLRHD